MSPQVRFAQHGALLSALGGVTLAVATNLLIFGLGYGGGTAGPGPINGIVEVIVPFVWVGLFAAMGVAIWLLRPRAGQSPGPALLVIGLLLNCMLYPVYTLGFTSIDAGLAGNHVTALLAGLATGLAWPRSRAAALCLAPILIWVSIATVGLYAAATGRAF